MLFVTSSLFFFFPQGLILFVGKIVYISVFKVSFNVFIAQSGNSN